MNSNSDNPKIGKVFQEKALKLLEKHYGCKFNSEVKIEIGESGKPQKSHKFDCVSEDGKYVAECKCYEWTEGKNIPSAKISILNQSLLFASFLPSKTTVIVMKKSYSEKRGETLAQHYFNRYSHLFRGTILLEVDVEKNKIYEIKEKSN